MAASSLKEKKRKKKEGGGLWTTSSVYIPSDRFTPAECKITHSWNRLISTMHAPSMRDGAGRKWVNNIMHYQRVCTGENFLPQWPANPATTSSSTKNQSTELPWIAILSLRKHWPRIVGQSFSLSLSFPLLFLLLSFTAVLSQWDFSHGKFGLPSPGKKKQLRQSRATQPRVHAWVF